VRKGEKEGLRGRKKIRYKPREGTFSAFSLITLYVYYPPHEKSP